MKIGFDGKRATQNFTGLGNYSRFVINNLQIFFNACSYVLFTPKQIGTSNYSIHNNIKIVEKEGFKPFWRTIGIVENIKKEQVDIYHGLSNELPYGIDKAGVKSVVTIHDLIFLRYPQFYPFIDRKIYNLKAKYACRVADQIIAVSEKTKQDIIYYYGIDPAKISVVYQGCDYRFKILETETKKKEILNKYDLPTRFLLSVGSIEDRKNILLIVKALKDIPDIHFVAIGKQRKYAQTVKEYAANNGLSSRLHFYSGIPLEDLPAILQSSEIFIYPSLYEGFGIPIIEALNSGVPVIGATGSCLEEAGGKNSIFVNPTDEKELAFQVNNLLNSPDLKQRMIKEGLEYVNRFSDQNCTKSLMDVYKQLISS